MSGAVHFIRSRQEVRELAWWLSLTAYDIRDRSLNNRIYLVYLILFFAVWIFVTLTLFAAGGAFLLKLVNPYNPGWVVVFLLTGLFSIWMVYGIWRSQRRSPVVFSEEDGYLICQTPVNRRKVTLRWLPMPWLKSAIPFWLAAITLGFSIAEVVITGNITANRLLEYAGFGFRVWMFFLPIHLGLYILQWVAGISRLRVNGERRWLAWVVNPLSIAVFGFLTIITFGSAIVIPNQVEFSAYAGIFNWGSGSALKAFAITLLPLWIFAIFSLGLMVLVSKGFNLSRAAEETRQAELIGSAQRYGFSSYAEQLKSQQRLRGTRAPSNLPIAAGAGVLVWKDILQSLRGLSFGSVFRWVLVFIISAGFPFLPDPGSRAIAVAFWMIQIAQAAVIRLRGDLSRWVILRQLAIPPGKFVLFELIPAYILSLVVSISGLVLSAVISNSMLNSIVLLIPGLAAGMCSMAAFDVLRRSHSDLLMAGSAPEISAGGMIIGLVVVAVPWLIGTFVSGWIGLGLAVLVSIGLAVLAFNLASYAFRKIDSL